MEESKIRLSLAELDLVQNADIILTKNTIIKKAISLLEQVQQAVTPMEENMKLPAVLTSNAPKISKGENYLGLPYVVLDYPRISHAENLCFIRTMFWWGHFFSSTLQVSGIYKQRYAVNIAARFGSLSNSNYFIGVHTDPWQHHFEVDNYRKINSLSTQELADVIAAQSHIKIAAHWPLERWDEATTILYKSWKLLAELIT